MSTRNSNLPPRSNGQQGGTRKPPTTKSVSHKKKKKKAKKRGFFARLGRALLIIIILLLLGVLSYGGYLYWKLEHDVFNTGTQGTVAPEHSAAVKPLTMLILGTDNRPNHESYLTDVIMVAALNPETKSASIVSLPRDTYVELQGYKKTKINAFYSRFKSKEKSSGILAEDEMKTMMGKYLDIDVDYVTILDFQGFRDVVDELNGVNVNISADMCYTDSVDGTDINLTKGPAKLNGDKALDYVRYRKSNCKPKTAASDDFERNKRQNEVLNAMVDQMQSLSGVLKIGGVLEAVGDNLKTDIENAQIKDIISTYWKIPKENIDFKPVTGTWRSPYVYINDKELKEASRSLQNQIAGSSSGTSEER